jgi:uncharacterized protein YjbI with pentapeptide repeats
MEKLYKIDGDIDDKELNELVIEGYYDYFEISNSLIKKCDFSKSNLQGVDIEDTTIISSNFSNSVLICSSVTIQASYIIPLRIFVSFARSL